MEQQNNTNGPDCKIWEQPENYKSRGLLAFLAAEAARLQGDEAFRSFHAALLQARHEKRTDIADASNLTAVAESSGLDVARFKVDIKDRRLLSKLSEDHTTAEEKLGIFGTPTLVFPGEQAVFFKLTQPPPPKDCLSVFRELQYLLKDRKYIQEIKKPDIPRS